MHIYLYTLNPSTKRREGDRVISKWGGGGRGGLTKLGPTPHQIHMSMYLMRECGGKGGWVGEVLNRGLAAAIKK